MQSRYRVPTGQINTLRELRYGPEAARQDSVRVTMKSVEIYTSFQCGYCIAVKRLFTEKGISFEEIDLARTPNRRPEMMQRSGGRKTVPQVFVGGDHVGGFDELRELSLKGSSIPFPRIDMRAAFIQITSSDDPVSNLPVTRNFVVQAAEGEPN